MSDTIVPFDFMSRMKPTGELFVSSGGGWTNVGDYQSVTWRYEIEERPVYDPTTNARSQIGSIIESETLTLSLEMLGLRGPLRALAFQPFRVAPGQEQVFGVRFDANPKWGPRQHLQLWSVALRPDGDQYLGRNEADFSSVRFVGEARPRPNDRTAVRFGSVHFYN